MKLNDAIISEFDNVIDRVSSIVNNQKTIQLAKEYFEFEANVEEQTFEYNIGKTSNSFVKHSDQEKKENILDDVPKPRTGSKIEIENENNILQIEELISGHQSFYPADELLVD